MNDHTAVKVVERPTCDFCLQELPASQAKKAQYDGRTVHGPWANMCEEHFQEYGIGLGLGRGQKLILKKQRKHE